MECSICEKNVSFKEWFINGYQCKQCRDKEKDDDRKYKDKRRREKIAQLKEKPKQKISKSILWASLYALAFGVFTRSILEAVFFGLIVFGVIRLRLWIKYRPLTKSKKQKPHKTQ